MMKKHLFAVTLLAALSACTGEKHEKEIAEIGKARTTLEKTDSLLELSGGEEAERLGTEIRNNVQYMQFNISKVGDSLDFKTWELLTDYQALLSGFESAESGHKQVEVAVDSASKSLDNLEHDLRNNTLDKSITPENAVEHESEQANELYEQAGEARSTFMKTKAGYDTLAPKIRVFMTELNQKLAEKQDQPK